MPPRRWKECQRQCAQLSSLDVGEASIRAPRAARGQRRRCCNDRLVMTMLDDSWAAFMVERENTRLQHVAARRRDEQRVRVR